MKLLSIFKKLILIIKIYIIKYSELICDDDFNDYSVKVNKKLNKKIIT